ncbi:MAG: hypothetical protein RLZZ464_1685 [Pseudomonadota bacterium]|jgi:Tfp pilus assembly protein PilN
MMADFNLLRYPTLDRQQRLRRQWRMAGMGAGLGAALVGSVLMVWAWQIDSLRDQTRDFQSQLEAHKRLAKERQQRLAKNQEVQKVAAQLVQLQAHQQAWSLLHTGLMEVTLGDGLRLQRLQVESGRIDLQGHAPQAQTIAHVAQRLSERWGVSLSLQSLEAHPAGEGAQSVSFAWQASWAALADGAVPVTVVKP